MVKRRHGDQVLDRVFAALGDATRRAILARLRTGPTRVSDLAQGFPITLAAVSKHVATLERAGLVRREARGREHLVHVTADGLAPAADWIVEQRQFWEARLASLDEHVRTVRPARTS